MNRTRAIIAGALTLAVIIAILLNNRANISAKSRNEFQGAIPVTVAQVREGNLSETLSLVGTITANNDVALVAEVAGKVTAVLAKVGDHVKAGAPIIQIDDEVKKAAFEQAEANYDRAKRDFDRFTSLRAEQAATQAQKENAWTAFKVAEAQYILARRQLRDTKVSSPIAGVVSARTVDLGTMVNDRMVIGNVVDVSRLKVKLNVAERDAFKLRIGDPVKVSTDVYPGVTFDGRISTISAKADEGHTYPVEILMDNNHEHPLRAGMFGRVAFTSVAQEATLAIPREALVGSMKDPQVFVVEGPVARLRPIVVSNETGTDLAVLSGLEKGQSVVVNGQNNLKDSVAVEVLK
ncbi:MAG TPA: efflux RND transporter periplasmic adaptor subunit [Bacteroidota bacterium]|nr:efflux RND transporter periplasmic adaptor subunit [Bacteroidota bacterium]